MNLSREETEITSPNQPKLPLGRLDGRPVLVRPSAMAAIGHCLSGESSAKFWEGFGPQRITANKPTTSGIYVVRGRGYVVARWRRRHAITSPVPSRRSE